MYACIAYDISSNRTRLRAGKWCKKIGLSRLQKSVFAGPATADKLSELESELRPQLRPTDKLAIIRLDKAAFTALADQSGDTRFRQFCKAFAYFDL